MKKILILNNAYMVLPHYLYQSQRLAEQLALLGAQVDVRPNNFFPVAVAEDGNIDLRLADYDACVYLDKDKYVSYMLERAGLRLFNRAAAVEACDDKMTTAIRLTGAGISMPYTLPGLLCFDPAANLPDSLFEQVEARLGYPFVLKTSFGSLGKGVYLVEDRAAFRRFAAQLKCQPHLYQQYIAESAGHDVRVIVVGGKVVAAMERRNKADFRSNIELGGTATPFALPASVADMCGRVAEILGLDYCGIDLLQGKRGYLVCEVNSNAFFGGMERTTGVNVAAIYAQYIVDSLNK